ncbi:hypothetical protein SprV_0200855100 [Sparganum proliferum]
MAPTDPDAHFESRFFQALLAYLNCTLILTTVYHRAASTIAKNLHSQLKSNLRVEEDAADWSANLLLALLEICATLKSKLGCSAAEWAVGTTSRLPREMLTSTSPDADESPASL